MKDLTDVRESSAFHLESHESVRETLAAMLRGKERLDQRVMETVKRLQEADARVAAVEIAGGIAVLIFAVIAILRLSN